MCYLKTKNMKMIKIKNKKQRNTDKNQMDEVKEERNILGYIMMKFDIISLNLALKRCLNLETTT